MDTLSILHCKYFSYDSVCRRIRRVVERHKHLSAPACAVNQPSTAGPATIPTAMNATISGWRSLTAITPPGPKSAGAL
jgi:hypothetical protein